MRRTLLALLVATVVGRGVAATPIRDLNDTASQFGPLSGPLDNPTPLVDQQPGCEANTHDKSTLDDAASGSTSEGRTPNDPKKSDVEVEGLPCGKAALTPAQRKLDSRLRDEIARRWRGVPLPMRASLLRVEIDAKQRALVEIRARLLTQVGWKIQRLKGTVVSSSVEYRSMIAWVPLAKLETLAADTTVTAIAPAPNSITVHSRGR